MKKVLLQTRDVHILVVDDNEVNLMIAQSVLKQFDAKVDTASSGAAAVKIIADSPILYDLVVLDYVMPGMDGLETARRIRALAPDKARVAIVAYTANHPEDILPMLEEVHVSDVLVKPLDIESIAKCLVKYVPEEKLLNADAIWAPEESDEDAKAQEETVVKTPFSEMLSTVDGLEYSVGMYYAMNDEENYYRVLRASLNSGIEAVTRMKEYSESVVGITHRDKTELSKTYGLRGICLDAHSIKGIYATIGIEPISHAAAELEHSATSGDTYYVDERLNSFIKWIESVNDELGHALDSYDIICNRNTSEADWKPVSAEEYLKLLQETDYHVRRFEIDAVNDCISELIKATEPEKREGLRKAQQAAQEFDYNIIADVIAEYTKEL